jgi:glycosyltransferase involved in cell wall biosynthesis
MCYGTSFTRLRHHVLGGPYPQAKVANLYASLDVLLSQSIWPESFGLVAREAQAQGLWVVASSRGAPSVNASSMERTVS